MSDKEDAHLMDDRWMLTLINLSNTVLVLVAGVDFGDVIKRGRPPFATLLCQSRKRD